MAGTLSFADINVNNSSVSIACWFRDRRQLTRQSEGWRSRSAGRSKRRMKLRIDQRYCGPPDSGNGGYVAGLVAKALGGSGVEVTLRAPPPLDVELDLRTAGDEAGLWDGETLVASARRAAVAVDVPTPPSFDEAAMPRRALSGSSTICFRAASCAGPTAPTGDGMRIFAGAQRRQRRGQRDLDSEPRTSPMPRVWSPSNIYGRRSIARAISRCARRPGWRCSGGSAPSSTAARQPASA